MRVNADTHVTRQYEALTQVPKGAGRVFNVAALPGDMPHREKSGAE